MKIRDFINEDSNQFGPGTDLMISLLAVLMVICLIMGYLYNNQKKVAEVATGDYLRLKRENEELTRRLKELTRRLEELDKSLNEKSDEGSTFKLSGVEFDAALFKPYPVDEFLDESSVRAKINQIAQEYELSQADFPYIFIIGHSNVIDASSAEDRSDSARYQRNWNYAGRRATVIAKLLQEKLPGKSDNIIVVSTGEFDLRDADKPISQENAWVEVKFGKEWK